MVINWKFNIEHKLKDYSSKHKRSSAYDNMWLQTNYTKEYTGEFGTYDFDDSLYVGVDSAWVIARKEISDHIPIWVTFYTDKDDD